MKNKTLTISLIIVGLLAIVFSTYARLSDIKDSNDSYSFILRDVPDTNIIINGNNLITKYYDEKESVEKELKLKLKDGKIKSVYLNGKKLSKEQQKLYEKEIFHSINTAQKAKEDITTAKEEMKNLDMEKIYNEIEEAKKEIAEINFEEINKEIEIAMREIEEINKEELANSLAMAKEELEKIDWIEISKELENVQIELTETFKLLNDDDFQKSIDVSIDHFYNIIPDIDDMIDAKGILIPDYSDEPDNSSVNEEKENELDSKLRSLEKK